MPNFNELFIIETDASGDGIGAVLTQQGKPIAFMSRALGLSKRSWLTYAREMLVVVQAIQTWRPYLLGRKFFIQTDQRSLKYFLEQRIVTPEQQKWVSKLLGYDYEIIYKPGKENSVVDALSCKVGSPCLNAMFVSQAQIWDEIKEVVVNHPYMQKLANWKLRNQVSRIHGEMAECATKIEWWCLPIPTSLSYFCENSMTHKLGGIPVC